MLLHSYCGDLVLRTVLSSVAPKMYPLDLPLAKMDVEQLGQWLANQNIPTDVVDNFRGTGWILLYLL